jgi:hypothetical protein
MSNAIEDHGNRYIHCFKENMPIRNYGLLSATPMTIREIGCCGAYCKTCSAFTNKFCRSCKLGYENGERDISKAKCQINLCCFKEKRLETCADCHDYPSCKTIQIFHEKKGYKYKKYKQSVEFIRKNGYCEFIEIAYNWKGPYGKLG